MAGSQLYTAADYYSSNTVKGYCQFMSYQWLETIIHFSIVKPTNYHPGNLERIGLQPHTVFIRCFPNLSVMAAWQLYLYLIIVLVVILIVVCNVGRFTTCVVLVCAEVRV